MDAQHIGRRHHTTVCSVLVTNCTLFELPSFVPGIKALVKLSVWIGCVLLVGVVVVVVPGVLSFAMPAGGYGQQQSYGQQQAPPAAYGQPAPAAYGQPSQQPPAAYGQATPQQYQQYQQQWNQYYQNQQQWNQYYQQQGYAAGGYAQAQQIPPARK